MNGFVALVISILIVVVGMLLFPSMHLIIGSFDISAFPPLAKAEITGMAYAFLAIVGYIVFKLWKKA